MATGGSGNGAGESWVSLCGVILLCEAGASRAPVFVVTTPSETVDAERGHIHPGRFAIHYLGEQFTGGRNQGKALIAVAEGEPQSCFVGSGADYRFHVGQAPGAFPGPTLAQREPFPCHLLGGGQLLLLGRRVQVGQFGASGPANPGAHGFEQESLLGVHHPVVELGLIFGGVVHAVAALR